MNRKLFVIGFKEVSFANGFHEADGDFSNILGKIKIYPIQ
jgi:hypothetical protein